MPDTILDRFGRTAVSGKAYAPAPRPMYERPPEIRLRLPKPPPADEVARMLPRDRHAHLLADCRHIYGMPLVRGAIHQRSQYVSAAGWRPVYAGADEKWGRMAEKWLTEANKISDVRGALFPFAKQMELTCRDMDRSTGSFWLLTATETGFPQAQILEAHRIGQRDDEDVVKSGLFAGATILNGIIYSTAGAPLAYRVLGATEAEDTDVPAENIIYAADAEWFSDGRPFPAIACGLRDFYQVGDIRDAELIAQKVNAYLTIIETNEQGRQDPVNALLNPTAANAPIGQAPLDVVEKGMFRFLKAGTGKLEAHTSNRPSDGAMKFERTIVAAAFYGMDWRIEMMDLSLLGGAGVRGFQDNINTSILSRFRALLPVAQRFTRYQIAKAMQRGDLPEQTDWWQWEFTQPPEFTVDPNRDVRADIEALRAGIDSEANIIRRNFGVEPESFYRLRARTLRIKQRVAEEEGVPVEALGTLSMPGDAPGTTEAVDNVNATTPGGADQSPDDTIDIANNKARMDAYGVGVRAGALTPIYEDEESFRLALKLPASTNAVRSVWEKEPARRPITLATEGGAPADGLQPAEDQT